MKREDADRKSENLVRLAALRALSVRPLFLARGSLAGSPSEASVDAALQSVLAFVFFTLRWPPCRVVLWGASIGGGPCARAAAAFSKAFLQSQRRAAASNKALVLEALRRASRRQFRGAEGNSFAQQQQPPPPEASAEERRRAVLCRLALSAQAPFLPSTPPPAGSFFPVFANNAEALAAAAMKATAEAAVPPDGASGEAVLAAAARASTAAALLAMAKHEALLRREGAQTGGPLSEASARRRRSRDDRLPQMNKATETEGTSLVKANSENPAAQEAVSSSGVASVSASTASDLPQEGRAQGPRGDSAEEHGASRGGGFSAAISCGTFPVASGGFSSVPYCGEACGSFSAEGSQELSVENPSASEEEIESGEEEAPASSPRAESPSHSQSQTLPHSQSRTLSQSRGWATALQGAALFNLGGLVLQCPFTSVREAARAFVPAAAASLFVPRSLWAVQEDVGSRDFCCNTLFLHGRKDELFSWEGSRDMYEALKAKYEKLDFCQGGGDGGLFPGDGQAEWVLTSHFAMACFPANATHTSFEWHTDVLRPLEAFLKRSQTALLSQIFQTLKPLLRPEPRQAPDSPSLGCPRSESKGPSSWETQEDLELCAAATRPEGDPVRAALESLSFSERERLLLRQVPIAQRGPWTRVARAAAGSFPTTPPPRERPVSPSSSEQRGTRGVWGRRSLAAAQRMRQAIATNPAALFFSEPAFAEAWRAMIEAELCQREGSLLLGEGAAQRQGSPTPRSPKAHLGALGVGLVLRLFCPHALCRLHSHQRFVQQRTFPPNKPLLLDVFGPRLSAVLRELQQLPLQQQQASEEPSSQGTLRRWLLRKGREKTSGEEEEASTLEEGDDSPGGNFAVAASRPPLARSVSAGPRSGSVSSSFSSLHPRLALPVARPATRSPPLDSAASLFGACEGAPFLVSSAGAAAAQRPGLQGLALEEVLRTPSFQQSFYFPRGGPLPPYVCAGPAGLTPARPVFPLGGGELLDGEKAALAFEASVEEEEAALAKVLALFGSREGLLRILASEFEAFLAGLVQAAVKRGLLQQVASLLAQLSEEGLENPKKGLAAKALRGDVSVADVSNFVQRAFALALPTLSVQALLRPVETACDADARGSSSSRCQEQVEYAVEALQIAGLTLSVARLAGGQEKAGGLVDEAAFSEARRQEASGLEGLLSGGVLLASLSPSLASLASSTARTEKRSPKAAPPSAGNSPAAKTGARGKTSLAFPLRGLELPLFVAPPPALQPAAEWLLEQLFEEASLRKALPGRPWTDSSQQPAASRKASGGGCCAGSGSSLSGLVSLHGNSEGMRRMRGVAESLAADSLRRLEELPATPCFGVLAFLRPACFARIPALRKALELALKPTEPHGLRRSRTSEDSQDRRDSKTPPTASLAVCSFYPFGLDALLSLLFQPRMPRVLERLQLSALGETSLPRSLIPPKLAVAAAFSAAANLAKAEAAPLTQNPAMLLQAALRCCRTPLEQQRLASLHDKAVWSAAEAERHLLQSGLRLFLPLPPKHHPPGSPAFAVWASEARIAAASFNFAAETAGQAFRRAEMVAVSAALEFCRCLIAREEDWARAAATQRHAKAASRGGRMAGKAFFEGLGKGLAAPAGDAEEAEGVATTNLFFSPSAAERGPSQPNSPQSVEEGAGLEAVPSERNSPRQGPASYVCLQRNGGLAGAAVACREGLSLQEELRKIALELEARLVLSAQSRRRQTEFFRLSTSLLKGIPLVVKQTLALQLCVPCALCSAASARPSGASPAGGSLLSPPLKPCPCARPCDKALAVFCMAALGTTAPALETQQRSSSGGPDLQQRNSSLETEPLRCTPSPRGRSRSACMEAVSASSIPHLARPASCQEASKPSRLPVRARRKASRVAEKGTCYSVTEKGLENRAHCACVFKASEWLRVRVSGAFVSLQSVAELVALVKAELRSQASLRLAADAAAAEEESARRAQSLEEAKASVEVGGTQRTKVCAAGDRSACLCAACWVADPSDARLGRLLAHSPPVLGWSSGEPPLSSRGSAVGLLLCL